MTDFLLPSQATRAPSGAGRPAAIAPDEAGADWLAPVAYDQWKRYLLPVPGGDPGELEPWTRVTTLAKLVGSEHGLTIWTKRNLLRGVGMRPSLRALLTDGHDDKAVLDEVIEAAAEAAGMNDARRWGTAIHAGIEAVMLGRQPFPEGEALAEQYGRDVAAGVECIRRNGMRVRLVERVVVHATLRYAGRLDYLVEVDLPATPLRQAQTVLRLLDVKTGGRITEQGQQVGAQLSGYVNATHLYDPATRTFEPLPDIDRTAGYVLEVRDGRAQLHEVDLLDGWIDMRLAVQQHRRGKAGTSMAPVGEPVTIEAPILDDLRAALASQADPLVQAMVEQAPDLTSAQAAVDTVRDGVRAALEHAQEVVAPVMAALGPIVNPAPAVEPERSPSGRARRACSKCRKPGHTAKRCPGDAPAADLPDQGAVPQVPTTIDALLELGLACDGTHADGWSVLPGASRPDVTVCGSCGLPSAATLGRLRGERAGLASLVASAVATELEASTAPAFVPPWQTPAFIEPAPQEQHAPPSLLELIDACASQEELGALWQSTNAAGGDWTAEHTQRAQERISSGLPILPGE
jgi:hypothetical protein